MSTIFDEGVSRHHRRHDVADLGPGLSGFLVLLCLLTSCGGVEPVEPPTSTEGAAAPTSATTTPTSQTGTSAGSALPAPRVFTEETPAGRYTMRLGDSSSLRLPSAAPRPDANGSSVEMIEVAFFTDPGYQEWELLAVETGETSIEVELDTGHLTWILVVID